MRKFILLFLLIQSSLESLSQTSLIHKFYPYRKGNLWGISDENGKIKINPSYTEVQSKVGFFVARSSMGKYDIFNSSLEKLFTADSVIRTTDDGLLALNFIANYTYKDSFIDGCFIGKYQYTERMKKEQFFAKGVVFKNDKKIKEVESAIAITRSDDPNSREPICGFLTDSSGYKGFEYVGEHAFFINPKYKFVNIIIAWGYYVFYNNENDFIVLKQHNKESGSYIPTVRIVKDKETYQSSKIIRYELKTGYSSMVIKATTISPKGEFILIDSNKQRNVYNKRGVLLTKYAIQRGNETEFYNYAYNYRGDIITVPNGNGSNFKFMDTVGKILDLETTGMESPNLLRGNSAITATTVLDSVNNRNVVTSFIDLKNLKYIYRRQSETDTLSIVYPWYIVQKGKEKSFYNSDAKLLFTIPASAYSRDLKDQWPNRNNSSSVKGIREGIGKPFHISSPYKETDTDYVVDDFYISFPSDLIVKKQGKWGVIGFNLKEIIAPQYDSILYAGNYTFTVKMDGQYFHIDSSNRVLFKGKYLDHIYQEPLDGYVICLKTSRINEYKSSWDKVYVADTNGSIAYVFDKSEYVDGRDFSLLGNGLVLYYSNKKGKSVVLDVKSKKLIKTPENYAFSSLSANFLVSAANKENSDKNLFSLIKMELLFQPSENNNEYTVKPYDSVSVFIYNHRRPVGIFTNKGVKLFED
jgi:hypothetical protein